MSCAKRLSELYEVEVHIVRFPIDKDAPFKFEQAESVFFYERNDYDADKLQHLVAEIYPDIIFCSGWIDKVYLAICSKYANKIPTVLMSDNQWKNTIRQNIASRFGRSFLLRKFSHCWVPGPFQFEYARRLGFDESRIFTDMYCADVAPFHAVFRNQKKENNGVYPRQFFFVGRFLELKGIRELCTAFVELKAEESSDWTMLMVGSGPLEKEIPDHEAITINNFVQPDQLAAFYRDAGVFVLPSHRDAWGVVIHESAAAGLPLIVSEACGAHPAFLKDGYNGYIHKPGNKDDLKAAMKKIMVLSDEELFEMGERSFELSKQITPESWSAIVWQLTTGGVRQNGKD